MPGPDLAASSNEDAQKPEVEKQQKHQVGAGNDVEPEVIRNPYFTNGAQSQDSRKKLPPWLDHVNAKDLKNLFNARLPSGYKPSSSSLTRPSEYWVRRLSLDGKQSCLLRGSGVLLT